VLPTKLSVTAGTTLTDGQKSEILVAVMGAALAAYKKHDMVQGAVGYAAIDCLSDELMSILGMVDSAIV